MSTIFRDERESAAGEARNAAREIRLLPSRLGSAVKVAVVVVGIVMTVAEVTQARKNWFEGNVAKESERLVRIQQEREQADIQVAVTAAKKNVQEEMKAVSEREAAVMSAIKPLQEGWGSALAQAAAPNMARYKEAYEIARRRANDCSRTNACPPDEIQRLAAEQSVYRMLFYSARASLYHHSTAKGGTVLLPKSEEIE